MTEQIIEKRRLASPATTPQALAWDGGNKRLWMGSRDLFRAESIERCPVVLAFLQDRIPAQSRLRAF